MVYVRTGKVSTSTTRTHAVSNILSIFLRAPCLSLFSRVLAILGGIYDGGP